jgi:hypothetical protein
VSERSERTRRRVSERSERTRRRVSERPGPAERRARRLVGAYPWRVREAQDGEIVATVLDALPPGAQRIPWRDQVDLVRGGLEARRRRRMSLGAHLRYTFQLRVADRWIPWVIDDLEAPGFRRRVALRTAVHLGLLAVVLQIGGPWPWWATMGYLVLGSGGSALRSEATRRQISARHGLGAAPPPSGLVWVRAPERAPLPDLPVAPLLAAVAVPLALGAAAALAAVVAAPTTALGPATHPSAPADLAAASVPPAVVGTGLGVVLVVASVLAALRARRSSPATPVAHARGTAVTAAVLAAGLVVGAGVVALQLWARQAPWSWGPIAAGAVPAAVGLAVGAGALTRAGRRRGRAVGLWELAPSVGPRRDVVAIAPWAIHLMPGAEPVPGDPRVRPGNRPPSG